MKKDTLVEKTLFLGGSQINVDVPENYLMNIGKVEIRYVAGLGNNQESANRDFLDKINQYLKYKRYDFSFIPQNVKKKEEGKNYFCRSNVLFIKKFPLKLLENELFKLGKMSSCYEFLALLRENRIKFNLVHPRRMF